MNKPFLIGVITWLGLTMSVSAADPRQITAAIDKGLDWLAKNQKPGGHWESVPKKLDPGDEFDPASGQWTGRSALAVWTLLAGGRGAKDPVVAQGIEFLKKNPTDGVYALGVRSQVWTMLPESPATLEQLHRDANLLLQGGKTSNDQSVGFYGYLASDKTNLRYDHSVSQFGVLGLWAGAQANVLAPRKYWEMTALSWMWHQFPDGAWGYNWTKDGPHGQTASMTAAGVATLFIVQDMLANDRQHGPADFNSLANFGSKEVNEINTARIKGLWQSKQGANDPVQVSIDAGMKWVGDHYDTVTANDHLYYTLFGISRIGAASGKKFLGTVDWYKQGADFILSKQNGDGSWGDVPDTCLALLFLERGFSPVMFNKLQYADAKATQPTHWNSRPRDVNNLSRWFGRAAEKFFNWQVVSLENGPDELHDAPVLYISGDQPLNFSEYDVAKLKEYVEQGGMIVANADDGKEPFAASFRKLGASMFRQYEFRELPADHPIYTAEQYPRNRWKNKPNVLGLSNGVRELMILIPRADPAKAWQAQATDHPELHQLAANLYLYMADKDQLRFRQPSYIVKGDPNIAAGKTVTVARLFYAGNCDPEPGGWRRLAAVAHNADHIDVTTESVKIDATEDAAVAAAVQPPGRALTGRKLPASPAPSGVLGVQKLAHLTGSVSFTWTAAQRQAIKDYVKSGGTLLIDAAGGASPFKGSVDQEMTATFGKEAEQLRRPADWAALTAVSPVARELAAVTNVTFRRGTEAVIGKGPTLRLRAIVLDGRPVVIYSPEDLTEGLVGEPVDGVVGYSPQTATDVVRAVVRGVAN